MSGATLEWVDANTPHAKLLHEGKTPSPRSLRNDSPDIRNAVERLERFQASVLREAAERPLVLAETA